MTRDEARTYVLEHSTEYFERDKSGKGYICPICGSGSGKNGTGITTKDGRHFTCWRGCFTNADIFDIIGKREGIPEGDNYFSQRLERACEFFGITLEGGHLGAWPSVRAFEAGKSPNKAFNVADSGDIQRTIQEAQKHLDETEYHRGISTETLRKFGAGYCALWRHPKAPQTVPTTPRLIIPHSDGQGYLARDTRANLPDEEKRYVKQHVGAKCLFNPDALKQAQNPVFVVEGEFDALSIIDAGGCAVALSGAGNIGKLTDAVRHEYPEQGIIITPDNDEAGMNAAGKLEGELTGANFFSYRHELPASYKDANEYLMTDRAGFTKWVQQGITACKEKMRAALNEALEEIQRESAAYALDDFFQDLLAGREQSAIPTGFLELDAMLDGGLYPGLYIVGAISSLGKTTFCLQVADNIARAGYPVLIFSLEMSRNELIAKSLSRLTLIKALDKYGDTTNAKTTRGILRADFTGFNAQEEILHSAVNDYQAYGQNLFITEGIGNIGVEEIRAGIKRYASIPGRRPPVVVIDYLQILSPYYNEKCTDKQNTDKNVLELKRMSRDYNTPIIGISSFNRENYSEPVSMASFKESGAIEYSSDVLIGFQYEGWDYQEGETPTARQKRIRTKLQEISAAAGQGEPVGVQAKILKHRNGRRGSIALTYYPLFNYFKGRGE